ncbi:glycosyltransferase family 2 protein [Megasphaera sueciensis]|uniref:glycosyltransferase family 2 protein n=1 Tax=Megasphaera sueciensis TaxID=349094 RepID=UPI003CFFF40F
MIATPFFTIIMSVYNVEKYLYAAVQSILKQDFTNFELILVDDCSTDSSYGICQKLAKIDSRIIILQNKINKGAASARNIALPYVKGTYVTFIDSDDYIETDLLGTAYVHLNKDNIDCLKIGCVEEYFDSKNRHVYSKICKIENGFFDDWDTIKCKMIEMELIPLFGYVWNAFYRVDIIQKEKIKFNERYAVNEDFIFNIMYFKVIKNLKCIDYYGYHYNKRINNSLSTKRQNGYYSLHMMKIHEFINAFGNINNMNDTLKEDVFWLYTRFIYSTLQRKIDINEANIQDTINIIKSDELFKIYRSIKFKHLNIKKKIMISALRSNKINVLLQFIKCIGIVKREFPAIFAILKR